MIASTSLKSKARRKKEENRRRTLEGVKTNRKVFIVFFKKLISYLCGQIPTLAVARIQFLILNQHQTELPGLYQCIEDLPMPPSLPSQEEAVSLVTSREKTFVHLNDISHQYYYPLPLSLNSLTFK